MKTVFTVAINTCLSKINLNVNKVAGNKINIQKSVFYMNNELSERECKKKKIPLKIAASAAAAAAKSFQSCRPLCNPKDGSPPGSGILQARTLEWAAFAFSLKTALFKIKYLGIYVTKEVKNVYSVNYKSLIKENDDDSEKWKETPRS